MLGVVYLPWGRWGDFIACFFGGQRSDYKVLYGASYISTYLLEDKFPRSTWCGAGMANPYCVMLRYGTWYKMGPSVHKICYDRNARYLGKLGYHGYVRSGR